MAQWIPALIPMIGAVVVSVALVGLAIYNGRKIGKKKGGDEDESPEKTPKENPKDRFKWIKENTWAQILLGYIVLSAGFWLVLPTIYWSWLSKPQLYAGMQVLIILLVVTFVILDEKKRSGFKWLMVLVILGIIVTSLGKETEITKSFAEVIPKAKANSSEEISPQPQQYVIVVPPAPDWSQPLSDNDALTFSNWKDFNIRYAKGGFRWKIDNREITFSKGDHLRMRLGDWWKIQFQSPRNEEIRIIFSEKN